MLHYSIHSFTLTLFHCYGTVRRSRPTLRPSSQGTETKAPIHPDRPTAREIESIGILELGRDAHSGTDIFPINSLMRALTSACLCCR